ncbi:MULTISPECIES: class I SAM-dependent methyltransferase [Nostoc]|uniref:Class I SAM-dependent methyltransferase n=2 Tax=Nostoc TaxID=1177 RepID=A0ABR8IDL2_9NOSO|nr:MULTISPECIES: class I SAM-dependent methyltransferase [Nostoc]MBD2563909.1 class I SAM-dependent methyltransferase [Nostoc linckia FACHB-391]MBD2649666.1 class I SAM-dependent methyltransferase [Nostoc foliaceum FACHB-393]
MKVSDFSYKVSHHLIWRAEQLLIDFQSSSINRELTKLGCLTKNNINTHMTAHELNMLYILSKDLGEFAKVLEIGSYLGASSCYIAAAVSPKNGHLFCVDTWENQTMPEGERDTLNEFKNNTKAVAQHITAIRKNSQELRPSDFGGHSLNLVFIDGDHSYQGAKNDYEKASSWIVGGGILAFHDCIAFEGVARTIGEALASGNWKFGGQVDNLLWLRKVEKGCLEFEHSAF